MQNQTEQTHTPQPMSKTILVIEDSEDIRENICELLELSGYTVHCAPNGKEGLALAKKVLPDLILCDIMMPELDGYGVLRAIGNIPELDGTPFVYLTAKSEKSDFRNAMDLGADDYLTKPFSGDELLRVVHARLKKSEQRKESGSAHEIPTISDFSQVALTFDELEKLSLNKTVKKLRRKDMVYMEGDSSTHLFYVMNGLVKTFKSNQWGKELITEFVKPGRFIGHLALLGDNVHKQSAMAIEDSEVALISRQSFYDVLASDHMLAMKFIRLLSDQMQESEEKLLNLAYYSARKRVAEALLLIYRQYQPKEDTSVSFPVNRENLSAIAGISPESVSRNLSDFKDENLIITDNGLIRITDFSALSKLRS